MEHRADLARPGPTPPIPTAEAIAAVRADARFRQAAAAIAATSIEYYQGRWLANRVLSDRARFIMAALMLFLHFDRRDDVASSGMTAARLREICTRVGLCSPGRIEAMLLMMRASGYLERVDVPTDRRVRRYAPTAKLIDLHRERHQRMLVAVDVLRGTTSYAPRLDTAGEFYRQFLLAMGRGYLAGFRVVEHAPEFAAVMDRDAGMLIVMSIFLVSPEYRAYCPEALQNVSVAGLARRFNVSRVHLRSVLRDAEGAGLVTRESEAARTRALPGLIDAAERFFATAFIFIESCAQCALTETA